MKKLTKIIETCSRYFCYIGAAVLVLMMLLVTCDVIIRAVTGVPLTGTYELVQYMLCLVIYSGFAFCQVRHGHMHVTMILAKMGRVSGMVLWALSSLLSAAMGVLLTVACWLQSITVHQQGIYSGLLHIPQYPFQLFCGVGMILFSAVLLLDGVKALIGIFKEEYAEEIRSHWVA